MSYTYAYPHPAVTVDCVVFGLADPADLELLLIRRGQDPFRGCWALPGGFVGIAEDLTAAARRELAEETGLQDLFLEQLYTFGEPARDPRERVITVAYYALVNRRDHPPVAATDAESARWFPVSALPELAFDHAAIIDTALRRLRAKVRYAPIGFELLPRAFTLGQLQQLYETILGRPLDKRNFRRRVKALGILRPLAQRETGVRRRPAQLHRFDRRRYAALEAQGLSFEL